MSRALEVSPGAGAAHHGGLFGRLLAPAFAGVSVSNEAVERLRSAYAQGTVIHVLRSRRVLDPVFILSVLDRLGLPKPRWMHDHYAGQADPTLDQLLASVRAGEPTLLFLRRPRTLIERGNYSSELVEGLLGVQRHLKRPIMMVPETLLLTRKAPGIRRSLIDMIFGDREAPGRIREMVGFLLNRKHARFHVGAPIDVKAFLQREKGRTHKSTAKKIRWSVLNHLAREEAIRAGPAHRSSARTRQLVINDPTVQAHLRDRGAEGEDIAEMRNRAESILTRMAADVRSGWVRTLDALLDRVWKDIYDGIVVDQEGLAKVWSAARRGPIVLVPSHKSHVDYLVLSQVFYKDGMMPPHIAAGDNLCLPLVGTVLRRGGAFFIRRSFKGDKLYALLVAAYVKRLLKEGHAVEFFIEGGRSRTGKQLAPKMGLLSMCSNPVLDETVSDVSFVPVSISYEKIVEAKSYAHELAGGKKKKEDLGALVSARRVLRSKYGRVYVDFDDPISLRAFAAARGFVVGEEHEKSDRRRLIEQLGHRIGYGIDRVTRVTPAGIAALVLLAHPRRGTAEEELHRRAEHLMDLATRLGARLSATLTKDTRRAAVREALGRLAGDGLVQMTPSFDGETIYQLDDNGRRALDYYKNNTLHFFAPLSIVCLAVVSLDGEADDTTLRQAAQGLSRLLKMEFAFRGGGFSTNFERSTEVLVERRVMERSEDTGDEPRWRFTHNGRTAALELAGLVAVFLESYRLVAEAASLLENTPMAPDAFRKAVLQRAQKQVLEGRIRRAEAASSLTIKNALSLLLELGFVETDEDENLILVSQERRKLFIDDLDATLSRLV